MFGGRTIPQRHSQRESTDFEPACDELRNRPPIAKATPNRNGLLANSGLGPRGLESRCSVQNMGRAPVVFVCYSHTNQRMRQQLMRSLKVMSRRRWIAPSLDTDLVPGENWNETLEQRLLEAQIILFMVSRAFLASEYITTKERPLAMRLMRQKKAVVVPIILSHCSWQEEDFAGLQKLPPKVESISDAPRENTWALVEEGLVKVVQNLPDHLADFGRPR
jgi:hypothetical protein